LSLSLFPFKPPSRSAQLNALLRILLCALLVLTAISALHAQSPEVEARVANVSGGAICSSAASSAHPVERGQQIAPGDEIDTRGGGHVVIEMTDGSVLIVRPGSRILFQNSTAAGSLFESFAVLLGRVQFKITHFAGRPNPYRVNSPTASIAVRGTDFDVIVQDSGSTEVSVSVGEVEVSSLSNPSHTVVVGPGSSVIVRPNETITFLGPGSTEYAQDRSRESRREIGDAAAIYEQYSDSLIEPAETAAPAVFLAFSDPHLDSIQNPAYATEFSAAEGQVLMMPSLSAAHTSGSSAAVPESFSDVPLNYAWSPQGTLFVPLPQLNSVVGGSFDVSHGTIQSLSIDSWNAHSQGLLGATAVSGSTRSTYGNISLMIAHAFGSSRGTSFGLAFTQVWDSGSLFDATAKATQTGLVPRANLASTSTIRRSEIVAGLTHVFSGGHKFGVEYHYGKVVSNEDDSLGASATEPLAVNSNQLTRGSSSEVRALLRGPLTRRLFYGLEGDLIFANENEIAQGPSGDNQVGPERTSRAVASAGLGYAPGKRILFAFDFAAGSAWTKESQSASDSGNLLSTNRNQIRFYSAHTAVQADIWRKLFASASLLSLTQTSQNQTILVFLEPFLDGGSQNTFNQITGNHLTVNSSDFGVGWRFSHNFLAEYIYSTDYGLTPSRHTLLLRHNFRLGHE